MIRGAYHIPYLEALLQVPAVKRREPEVILRGFVHPGQALCPSGVRSPRKAQDRAESGSGSPEASDTQSWIHSPHASQSPLGLPVVSPPLRCPFLRYTRERA